MTRFAALARLFVIRTMKEERFLTLLSVVGVALGIGLFVGVKLASDKAVVSLESGVRGISATATHEVYDPSGVDFDESVYRDLALTEPSSLPVLSTTGTFGTQRENLHVMGVYTLKAVKFLGIGGGSSRDLEHILTVPDGVAVPEGFAKRNSLRLGDSFTLSLYDRHYTVSVAAVVNTDRWPPDTVIMDLGNYQELFGKVGYLTKIDLSTDDRSAETLSTVIPTHLVIEKKEDLIRNKTALIASFRYNLQFVSLIAILVGMFLLYNTIFISVVKRRTEIGIIRALGASKSMVVSLFTVQGLILGGAGSVLGIALGQVTAYLSVNAVKKTVSTMFTAVSISDYLLSTKDVLIALGLGLVVSLIASALPAFEAARIRPQESAREGSFEGRYKKYLGHLLFLGVILAVAGCGLSFYEYHKMPFSFPALSYVGILLIILGFTCSAPLFLVSVLRLAQRPLAGIFKAAGKITVGDMRGSAYRFSIALMSVAISSALIIALMTLIFSFRASLIDWIDRTIAADVYIKPASCTSNYCFQALSPEVIETVAGLPEVDSIDRYRALQVELRGRRVIAGFGTTAVTRRFGTGRYFDRLDDERLRALEYNKEVAISHYLATRYGLKRGDGIDIETPSGTQRFTV
ncbi:MAG TPA: FtsX-like permease family protein, partial [Dissulfurispiraceae bacterium]|nr:FtsX-like permease family protein [Dissulfurispiraceae bacterium]